jgi:Fe-S oxidoreductase
LPNLFPHDEDAKRLDRQTFSFGEFLVKELDWTPPRLERRGLVHLHCHQRATCDTDIELSLLERMGVEYEAPDSGCCGLAGSFGYEAGERYEVSMKAGERVLLPAVRNAPDALIITDGFSCRSQIEHGAARRALHTAEVIQLALRSREGAHDARLQSVAAPGVT